MIEYNDVIQAFEDEYDIGIYAEGHRFAILTSGGLEAQERDLFAVVCKITAGYIIVPGWLEVKWKYPDGRRAPFGVGKRQGSMYEIFEPMVNKHKSYEGAADEFGQMWVRADINGPLWHVPKNLPRRKRSENTDTQV